MHFALEEVKMKQNKVTKVFASVVLAAFFFTMLMAPAEVQAKWHPRTDELPGMDDDEFIKKAALVAGAVVVLGIILKVSKNKTAAPTEEESPADAPQDSSAASLIRPEAYAFLCSDKIRSVEQPKFVPYVDLLPNAGRMNAYKGGSFSVGLAFNF